MRRDWHPGKWWKVFFFITPDGSVLRPLQPVESASLPRYDGVEMTLAAANFADPSHMAVLVSLAVGTAALIAIRRIVRETTITATWWWALGAFTCAGLVELLDAAALLGDAPSAAAWRYAARSLLLCPAVSLIGAKRPQDGPWNFVVVSLWGILVLPAANALLLGTGQPLLVYGFQSWFLVVLVLLTLVGMLPTKHGFAAVLAAAGQALLLQEYLPLRFAEPCRFLTAAGMVCLASAAVLLALRAKPAKAATSLDRLWIDFRDTFGLFWALRVQERLHAAAKQFGWPVQLHWTGWGTADGHPLREELPQEQLKPILVTLRGLLRRFVSNAWIDERSG
jgi:hypothetical protein